MDDEPLDLDYAKKFTDEQIEACKSIAKRINFGPLKIYAKMYLAMKGERGIRLSLDELELIFSGDDSVTRALWEATHMVIEHKL